MLYNYYIVENNIRIGTTQAERNTQMQLTEQQQAELIAAGFDIEEEEGDMYICDYITPISEYTNASGIERLMGGDVQIILNMGNDFRVRDCGYGEDADGVERTWIMI